MHMAWVRKTVCSCVCKHSYTGVGRTYREAGSHKFRSPEFKSLGYENHTFKASLGKAIRLYFKIRKKMGKLLNQTLVFTPMLLLNETLVCTPMLFKSKYCFLLLLTPNSGPCLSTKLSSNHRLKTKIKKLSKILLRLCS